MKIPTTIVTGFLGAGKTSLIASLLKQSDMRLGLLINEFGSVGMDGAILADADGCDSCPMIELANGCICCTIADDFVPAMESLASLDEPPHHVVIETSGLALPQPLVKAFDWHSVRTRFYVQGVVTVLDCQELAGESHTSSQAQLSQQDGIINHDKAMDELLTEQLHHGDIILMNKADCVTEEQRDAIRMRIRPFHHEAVRVHETHHGKFPMSLLLDEGVHRVHDDDHHDHDHHHHHDHDDFSSVSLQGGVFASQDELEQAVMNCMARHSLYRLKGMVTIAGRSLPMVVQAVGKRVHCYHARGGHQNNGSSVVVAIGGRALDGDAIGRTLGHDFKPCTS